MQQHESNCSFILRCITCFIYRGFAKTRCLLATITEFQLNGGAGSTTQKLHENIIIAVLIWKKIAHIFLISF